MNVIELFSCSGGMAEGLRRAGIHVTTAIDFDENACASYEKNLGERPIRMDVRDLLRLAWAPTARIDLFVADPPCTPWSRAGKRKGLEDQHDMLLETVALVRHLKPRAFLIANVPGLDDGPNWPIVQRTIGSLSKLGYCIDFARLDAADYGVPQHRFRPFWYGHLHAELPCVQWPARTHGSPQECRNTTIARVVPIVPWVTCWQALGLGTTITTTDRMAPPGHHEKSFLSDNRGKGPNAIKLSEKAAAILQGFPESWVFVGKTKRARWQQLGMAMPPGLAEAVGRSIARALQLRRWSANG
jgi:DNA (cytosine-5)-methyltransferase 1